MTLPVQPAAEKAMEAIEAALDGFYRGDTSAVDALNAVARAQGAYSVERIGESLGDH